MTTQCPICRSPVEVEDAKIGADGVKAQCSLCDEVFLVRPAMAAPPPANTASRDLGQKSSDKTSTGSGGSGSASRRILQEDSGDGAAPRVLVAHDSHSVADLMRTLLEEEGFDVEIVHDGDAAARSLTTNPPTVAILEAGLPKRFGFQLCADMRGKTDTQGVKFVLVASIYDRTRLGKSSPLANAPDDFVDPRNIETEIVPKVRKLARRAEGTGSRAASIAAAPAAVREPAPVATAPAAAASEEIDFGELFEEGSMTSGTGNSGLPPRESSKPAARPDGSPPIFDVDEFLAEDEPAVAAPAPAAPPARAAAKAPPRGVDDDEREIWERVLAEEEAAEKANDDGEDLLKSLMEIAAKEPESSESSISRDRFPSSGPLDLPSTGPLPASWKDEPGQEGGESGDETDGDALEAILNASNGAELPSSPRMASSDGGMELGGMFEGADDEFPVSDSPSSSRAASDDEEQVVADADTLMNDGFSSGSDDDDEALLRAANASIASSGTVPGEQREAPTVLKNGATGASSASIGSAAIAPPPATKPRKDDVLSAADFAAELAGDSSGDSSGDDDEKSLAEAKPFDARTGGSTQLGGAAGKSEFGAHDDEGDAIDRLLTAEPGSAPRDNPVEVKTSLNADPIETELSNGNDAIAGAAGEALLAIEHDKARRLAKLIVGDIVLYNADRIADAVRSGNFFEVMKGDIKDGRDFYEEKVPDVVRAERDHIQEILLEVIANKKKELGLS